MSDKDKIEGFELLLIGYGSKKYQLGIAETEYQKKEDYMGVDRESINKIEKLETEAELLKTKLIERYKNSLVD